MCMELSCSHIVEYAQFIAKHFISYISKQLKSIKSNLYIFLCYVNPVTCVSHVNITSYYLKCNYKMIIRNLLFIALI